MEGKWTVYKSENYENYLDALGMDAMKKSNAVSQPQTVTIAVDGDTINTTISVGPRTTSVSYKLGEEYSVHMMDFTAKGVTVWKGGQMITTLTPNDPSKKAQTITREMVNGEMIQNMTHEGVTAKRYWKKC